MKKLKSSIAFLLVLALMLINAQFDISNLAFADGVYVTFIVENNNLTTGPQGEIINEEVKLQSGDTALSVLESLLDEKNISYTYDSSYDYIAEIAGLQNCWMFSYDDYYGYDSISHYSYDGGTLKYGDVVKFSTTADYGSDLGSYWSNNDTRLKSLSVDNGYLDRPFDSDYHLYILNMEEDSGFVKVSAEAMNKNYMVRVYKNDFTPEEEGTDYAINSELYVEKGDVLYVCDGYSSWPSMNGNDQKENVYVIVVGAKDAFGGIDIDVNYRVHVQSFGWESDFVKGGEISGTVGKAKRLEGIQMKLVSDTFKDAVDYLGGVEYRTHIQKQGWEKEFVSDGKVSGTVGKGLRLEAIQIKLFGDIASKYSIYYAVQAEKFGWLGFARDGESAGTEGYGYRLEAIKAFLVNKSELGYIKIYSQLQPFYKKSDLLKIKYKTQVQTYGWEKDYVGNGEISGTVGKAKRLEAIRIKLENNTGISGGIEYRTHVQKMGWLDYVSNDAISGTVGKGLRLEAISIRLTGDLESYFDIYYQVHAEHFGWLGFAKNGEDAGTAGYGYRLEGIRIYVEFKDTLNHKTSKAAFVKK